MTPVRISRDTLRALFTVGNGRLLMGEIAQTTNGDFIVGLAEATLCEGARDMNMGRKDFIRLVRVARVMRGEVSENVFEKLVVQLTLAAGEDSPRFDHAKFHDACFADSK